MSRVLSNCTGFDWDEGNSGKNLISHQVANSECEEVFEKIKRDSGILMLRELDTQYPGDPSVLFHLGRLAAQTGQWDRAVERLSKSVEINPHNRAAWCLLAQAYEETGNQAKAAECSRRCDETN